MGKINRLYPVRLFIAILVVNMLLVSSFFSSCQNANRFHYINETDTTFSKDIQIISAQINNGEDGADNYLERGEIFFADKRYIDALEDAKISISKNGKQSKAYNLMGDCYLAKDSVNAKKALKAYSQAIAIDPQNINSYFKKGKLFLALMQNDSAQKTMNKVLDINPGNDTAFLYKGIAYKQKQDTIMALKAFNKAILNNDNNYDANMQIGLLKEKTNTQAALAYYKKALRINPQSWEAYYAIGLNYQNDKKYKDAMKMYEEVVKLNPYHKFAHYNMAYIQAQFENYNTAINTIDNILKLDEEFDDGYYIKGFCNEMLKHKDEAKKNYKQCLKINPIHQLAKKDLENLINK